MFVINGDGFIEPTAIMASSHGASRFLADGHRPRKKPPCRAASKILAVSLSALYRRTSAAISGRHALRTAATGARLRRLQEAPVGLTAFDDSSWHQSDECETIPNR